MNSNISKESLLEKNGHLEDGIFMVIEFLGGKMSHYRISLTKLLRKSTYVIVFS